MGGGRGGLAAKEQQEQQLELELEEQEQEQHLEQQQQQQLEAGGRRSSRGGGGMWQEAGGRRQEGLQGRRRQRCAPDRIGRGRVMRVERREHARARNDRHRDVRGGACSHGRVLALLPLLQPTRRGSVNAERRHELEGRREGWGGIE